MCAYFCAVDQRYHEELQTKEASGRVKGSTPRTQTSPGSPADKCRREGFETTSTETQGKMRKTWGAKANPADELAVYTATQTP